MANRVSYVPKLKFLSRLEFGNVHNELHSLYSSPNIIRSITSTRMRWVGLVARTGAKRNAYRVLVGKPEGKRPLERLGRRWEDNIKIYFTKRGWVYGLHSSKYRDQRRALVNAAMDLRVL
jgi:hypothetical protein